MPLRVKQREDEIKEFTVIEDKGKAEPFKPGLLLCALFAFLLSRSNIGGSGAPAAAAFMAALSPVQCFAAFAGLAAAIFLSGNIGAYITEAAAALVIISVKYAVSRTKKQPSAALSSVCAGGIYLACGLVTALFFRITPALVLAVMFRAALCFIIAYFILEFFADFGKSGQIHISGDKSISVAVIYILIICALASLTLGYFNIGRAFGAFALLTVTAKRGAAGGAAAGALTALGLMLASYDLGRSAVILTCAGLLAGVLSNNGRLTVSVAFITASFIGTVITGMHAGSAGLLFDAAIASILFALLPAQLCVGLLAETAKETADRTPAQRLDFAAAALRGVKGTVTKASKALSGGREYPKAETEAAVEYLTAVEGALDSLRQFDDLPFCDTVKAAAVKRALGVWGARDVSVSFFYDTQGHVFIECYYEKKNTANMDSIIKKISGIADKELDIPHITNLSGVTRLCLHEPPPLTAEVGLARRSGSEKNGGEDISGDSENYFSDGLGKMFFILSDGMGMGGRAAVESRMTVSIMTDLLKAGFEAEACFQLTNLLMNAKSSDEIFSTVDLLILNLFSGKTVLIKSGAPATLVNSKGIVKIIEAGTMPSGIIGSADFEKRTLKLREGDCAVMTTDGIGENCFPKIKELMLSQGVGAQYSSDEIIKYACENEISRPDDKTVITIKVHSS